MPGIEKDTSPKEGKRLNDLGEFSSVDGMESGPCIREMCFGCDDRAKHDTNRVAG